MVEKGERAERWSAKKKEPEGGGEAKARRLLKASIHLNAAAKGSGATGQGTPSPVGSGGPCCVYIAFEYLFGNIYAVEVAAHHGVLPDCQQSGRRGVLEHAILDRPAWTSTLAPQYVCACPATRSAWGAAWLKAGRQQR